MSKSCSNFAQHLREKSDHIRNIPATYTQTTTMIDWNNIKETLRKYLINKYILAILIFALVFLFIGDQSIVSCIRRGIQIKKTQAQVERARQDTEHALRTIQVLQDTDSLERFAREQYGMHADGEDIYLIDN